MVEQQAAVRSRTDLVKTHGLECPDRPQPQGGAFAKFWKAKSGPQPLHCFLSPLFREIMLTRKPPSLPFFSLWFAS